MDYIATQKYLLLSPKKIRAVTFLIKKMSPEDAVLKLPFIAKHASDPLKKVILTAIANAKQQGANTSDLIFKEIQIGEGPRLKRFRAGSRGRAKPYKKRMSHIRIVLTTKPIANRLPSTAEKKSAEKEKFAVASSQKTESATKGAKHGTKS
jgi:large subunit ribosomal protein L22